MFKNSKVLVSVLFMLAVENGALAVCPGVYFKKAKTQNLNVPIYGAAYIDIDQDGIKDLIGNAAGNIAFYKGSANGFAPAVITNGDDTYFLSYGKDSFADFNNDGKLDMIGQLYASSPQNRAMAIYLNNGNGGFTRSTVSQTGALPFGDGEIIVALADLNGDNRPDVLTNSGSSNFNGSLFYRLLDADNHFGAAVFVDTDVENVFVRDLNADGKNDLVYTNSLNFNEFVKSRINQGNGTFAGGGSRPVHDRVHDYNSAIFADVNNDGRPELVSQIYTDFDLNNQYYFSVFEFDAAGAITETAVNATTALERTLAQQHEFYNNSPRAGDFDGDGSIDLIFLSPNVGAVLAKNNGSLSFNLKRFGAPGSGLVTDFNTDGKPDLMSLNGSSVTFGIFSVTFKQNVCEAVGQTKFVDFDGNGESDIAFWHPANGQWEFYEGVGFTGFNGNVQWGSGALGDIPVPQDYDGDGYTDFAVYRNSTGFWYIYRTSDGQTIIANFGLPGDKPVPSDYDGDGRADLGVFRPSEGNWYYLPSGSPQKLVGIHWGLDGDTPLPMDYNGDGSSDIAIYRPSSGAWYIWMTNGDGYTVNTFGGAAGDRPIPADYDNDGRADLAMFRPNAPNSGLNWFLATAGNLYAIQLGVPGDTAFPVTSSSSARPAIFHPANAKITIHQTGQINFSGAYGRNVSWILPLD